MFQPAREHLNGSTANSWFEAQATQATLPAINPPAWRWSALECASSFQHRYFDACAEPQRDDSRLVDAQAILAFE